MKKPKTILTLVTFQFLAAQLIFICCAFLASPRFASYTFLTVFATTLIWMLFKFIDPFKHLRLPAWEGRSLSPLAQKYVLCVMLVCILEAAVIISAAFIANAV